MKKLHKFKLVFDFNVLFEEELTEEEAIKVVKDRMNIRLRYKNLVQLFRKEIHINSIENDLLPTVKYVDDE